jgi:antitoxin VapB
MAVAKVFRTGRSQAIRLPKEFRVDADTVHLKRTAEGFLVITKDPWEIFFEGVEQLSDKFLAWERVQPELESRGTAISS